MELEPSSCYFIDDSPANVEAAIRAGMQGCVYHQDPLELMDNLKKAGIVFGRRFFGREFFKACGVVKKFDSGW